jgi:hypothetical protein
MKLHDFDVNSLIQMLKSVPIVALLCFSDLKRGREDCYTLYVLVNCHMIGKVYGVCMVMWCGVV